MKTMLLILMVLASVAMAGDGQDINSWTAKSLNDHFGAAHVKYVGHKVKAIAFGPTKHFHNGLCFSLILEILRGPEFNPDPNAAYPDVDTGDLVWIDRETNVTINQLQGFVFVAVKSKDATEPASSNGSIVLTAHLIDDEQGEWFVLSVQGPR
jgi:hypothetical protein